MQRTMLMALAVLAFGGLAPALAAPGALDAHAVRQAADAASPATPARCSFRKWCGPAKCHRRLWCR